MARGPLAPPAVAVLAAALVAACAPGPRHEAAPEVPVPPRVGADGRLSPADERAWLDTSDLVYTSVYLSFVGKDAHGFVAFALDTNRGRDGTEFQAEHYVAMHDQRRGWIDMARTGRYGNARSELVAIPASPFFRFVGDAQAGLLVDSPPNGLALEVGPVVDRVVEHDARTYLALGSAPATLRWEGRTVPGRVIHEDLVKTGFNLMTRPDVSGLRHFNGFYLLTADGGDLYLHGVEALPGAPAVPSRVVGFRADAATGRGEALRDLRVDEAAHGPALGFYRWPTAWTATWQGERGPATLRLEAGTRKGMVNWLIGGYALAIVEGELVEGGRATPVYGWGELIR
jgi:hypothetical protein